MPEFTDIPDWPPEDDYDGGDYGDGGGDGSDGVIPPDILDWFDDQGLDPQDFFGLEDDVPEGYERRGQVFSSLGEAFRYLDDAGILPFSFVQFVDGVWVVWIGTSP